MVINYQGPGGIRKKKKTVQSIKVEDYMSRRLVTFRPDQTIDEVVKILLAKRISGGPVIDKDNNLIGIISEGDCLKEIMKGKYNNSPRLTGLVKDHMAHDVKTITPDMNIFELTKMFLELRLRRFPVLQDGKLVGQISQKDVMRAVSKLYETTW